MKGDFRNEKRNPSLSIRALQPYLYWLDRLHGSSCPVYNQSLEVQNLQNKIREKTLAEHIAPPEALINKLQLLDGFPQRGYSHRNSFHPITINTYPWKLSSLFSNDV